MIDLQNDFLHNNSLYFTLNHALFLAVKDLF